MGEDIFAVTLEQTQASSRWDLAHFPTPDRPQAQSASVRALRAYTSEGEDLAIEYIGDGAWSTPDGQASRLTYQLVADHGEVDWNISAPGKDEVADIIDGTYVFAGHAFFLIDWELPRCDVTVSFDLPSGWQVVSPWDDRGDHHWVRETWALGQNMFGMGPATPYSTSSGGLDLTWLVDPRLAPIMPTIESILGDLPAAYTEFWGEAAGEAYTIFFMADYTSDGGVFYDSFAMRIALPLRSADQINWSHTLGHEVMHLWNPIGRTSGRNVPELEWVIEGFTDYLTLKLMAQAGYWDTDLLEQRIANIFRGYYIAGLVETPESIAQAGYAKGDNWYSVYSAGSLIAMFLDAELSQDDPERFADVMRQLAADRGDGYSFETFMARFDTLTDGRASEIYTWIESRPSNAEYIERMSDAGMDISFFVDEVYVRFPACDDQRCPPDFLAPPPDL
ncbi:hypothetical protein [Maricaulis sp.]|uniref:M61 family metallopeptidase n=1 Tax=Maricaulis sp. TaxID=1486257 RepID=UPI0026144B2E|nr:hypothetical protein [Maricaulis sp.]